MPSRQKATAAVAGLVGGAALFEHEHPRQAVGHAQDGVGEDEGVVAPDHAGGDARLHVGEGVGHGLLLALADERREPFLGPGELEKDEEVAVGVQPCHRRPDARLDAADGIGLVGDGLALGPAEVALGVGQDLAQELLLGGEVPVEDALAHAEAVDDVGDRRGVVSLRWRIVGRRSRAARGGAAVPVRSSGVPSDRRYLWCRTRPPGDTHGRFHCATPARYRGAVAYWVLKVLLSPFFFVLWRVKVEGREHVPATGP